MYALNDLLKLVFSTKDLFVMAGPSRSALLHRKPASIGKSRDSCGVQDSYKGNALCV